MITLDLELPEGFEAVGYWPPKKGQWFLATQGGALRSDVNLSVPRIVLRQKHKWPKWLKPGWVTVDSKGQVEMWTQKPAAGDAIWIYARFGGTRANISQFIELPLPEYTDWREACWEVRHDD